MAVIGSAAAAANSFVPIRDIAAFHASLPRAFIYVSILLGGCRPSEALLLDFHWMPSGW